MTFLIRDRTNNRRSFVRATATGAVKNRPVRVGDSDGSLQNPTDSLPAIAKNHNRPALRHSSASSSPTWSYTRPRTASRATRGRRRFPMAGCHEKRLHSWREPEFLVLAVVRLLLPTAGLPRKGRIIRRIPGTDSESARPDASVTPTLSQPHSRTVQDRHWWWLRIRLRSAGATMRY